MYFLFSTEFFHSRQFVFNVFLFLLHWHYRNLLWLNPKDLATSKYVKAVCVEKCPDRDYRVAQEIPLEFCLPGATRGDDKLCPDTPLFRS